jgi:DNA-binding response OmpR family regulator
MSQAVEKPLAARRVLVVEDEPEVCELISDYLQAEGFEPSCVRSDEEAVRVLRGAAQLACMIVDVNLGRGATGFDVARAARRLAPQLPVVFVSGQTSADALERFGVTGALFLPKPFTAAELMEQVRRLVGDNDD